MSSTRRLSRDDRRNIRQHLMKRKFGPLQEALNRREEDLAMAVRAESYSASELEQMESLPKGWLPETDTIRGVFAGQHVVLHLRGKKVRITANKSEYGMPLVNLEARHKLVQQVIDWLREKNELNREMGQLENELASVLGSVQTVPSLLKLWPELKDTIDEVLGKRAVETKVLTLPIKKLNKALGLKKVS